MRSIKESTKNEIVIKKSKFICHLYKVNTINEIKDYLEYINKEYKDATHNCYAYICGNLKKMSDDGEPSGTAGMPILNILETNSLDMVLCVVTRYFGGIKLGANGLVRAYADSVKEALEKAEIIELFEGKKIKISFSYDNIKQLDYILKDYDIIEKHYNEDISYIINIPNNINLNSLISKYIITYEELGNIYIEAKKK